MEELSKYSESITEILKDIDDTYAQIKLTSSQNRKQDLWRHIEKQQRKLRKMMKRDS